jgi:GT2 family glycosyltransferase
MVASVIICTYNRSPLLGRVLRSLAYQSVSSDEFEIIVVDDGSTDGTARLCAIIRGELPNMRYISTGKNLGLGCAENIGVRSARGKYLLFIDDDCIAQKDWVEGQTAALERQPVVAGAIASPASSYIKLCHNLSQFHAFMKRRKTAEMESLAGANMGLRPSVLRDLGGFDEKSKAPDWELMLRARSKGYPIYFAPEAVVLHDPDRKSLASILRHSSDHASQTILLRNKYRSILRTPFVLRSPALLFFLAPLIALVTTLKIFLTNWNLIRYSQTAPLIYAQKLAWCWGAAKSLFTAARGRKTGKFERAGVGPIFPEETEGAGYRAKSEVPRVLEKGRV